MTAARKELRDLQIAIRGLKKAVGQERNQLKCGLNSQLVKVAIRQTIAHLQATIQKLHKESMRIIKEDPELRQLYKCLNLMCDGQRAEG